MEKLKALWNGDVSLAKTFWLYGFCMNLFFALVFSFYYIRPHLITASAGRIIFWSFISLALVYGPFALIAIWRSAGKYTGLARYATLAKIMVVIGWVRYVKDIAQVGMMTQQ